MLYSNFEEIIAKVSFLLLFFLMLFYWVQASFLSLKKYRSFGFYGMIVVNILLVSLLIARWYNSGHFPLSNLYESLLFLSWSFISIQLIVEIFTKNSLIGIITSPLALFTNAFANFSLPVEMQKATALVPALQSNWLMMHVTIMMISYAALIAGSVFSMVFLIVNSKIFNSFFNQNQPLNSSNFDLEMNIGPEENLAIYKTFQDLQNTTIENRENSFNSLNTLSKNLDTLSYRTLGLGFPFLTIGILSGAVWANEAWGSYWSWDPKETWAFITWLVFAIYLHTRIIKGWEGSKPAIIATFGFIVVWVCYLGVNLLGTGLHSYGWFNT